MSNTVIVIANTDYHFEITLSTYQALIDSGYNPVIYSCHGKQRTYSKQIDFLNINNIRYTHNINTIPLDTLGGIVISAYPDHIPNDKNLIFDRLKNKLIYICHRFNTQPSYIDKYKTICLSPLSQYIGLPYIIPNKYPICISSQKQDHKVKLLIQAHFERRNRDIEVLNPVIDAVKANSNIELHIIGTGIPLSLRQQPNSNIIIHSKITEQTLYSIINNMSYILPLIDEKTKDGTYLKERYSSNFCHSLCMNKPIIAHNIFKKIYNLPGIYYTSTTELSAIIENISNVTPEILQQTTIEFDLLRVNSIQHNKILFNRLF